MPHALWQDLELDEYDEPWLVNESGEPLIDDESAESKKLRQELKDLFEELRAA